MADPVPSNTYQIRLRGHLRPNRGQWFEQMSISLEANGETVITGAVADQAALHGLLRKIRDLGMPLLSLQLVETE